MLFLPFSALESFQDLNCISFNKNDILMLQKTEIVKYFQNLLFIINEKSYANENDKKAAWGVMFSTIRDYTSAINNNDN